MNWGAAEGLRSGFRSKVSWELFWCPEISHRRPNSSSLRWVIGARVPLPTNTKQIRNRKGHVCSSFLKAFISEKSDYSGERNAAQTLQKNLSSLALPPSPSLSPECCTLCPITHLGGFFFFIDSKDDRHFLTGSLIFLEKDKIYKLMSSNCRVGLSLSFLVLVVC